MKCKKILTNICIVVIAVLFFGVKNWGIPWLENQISTQLLRALPEGSTVGKVSYSPFGNSVTIEELKIPNPPGYSGTRKAVVVKRLYADLNVPALFRRVIYLESLEIGPVDIQLEFKNFPKNFDELLSAEWIKSGCNLLDLIQIMTNRTKPEQKTEEKPDQLAETPEQKTVEKPEQVAENPEQVAEKPEQVAENPEQVAEKPEQVAEKPEPVAEKTEQETGDPWKLRIDKLQIDSVRVYFPNLKVPQNMKEAVIKMVLSVLPPQWQKDERSRQVVELVGIWASAFVVKNSEVLSTLEQGIEIPRYEQKNLGQNEKTSCRGVVFEIAERHWTHTMNYGESRLNKYLKKVNTNLDELKKNALEYTEEVKEVIEEVQEFIDKNPEVKEKVEKAQEFIDKNPEVKEKVKKAQEFIDKNPEVKEKVDKAKDKFKDWWKKRSSKR